MALYLVLVVVVVVEERNIVVAADAVVELAVAVEQHIEVEVLPLQLLSLEEDSLVFAAVL